MENIISWLNGIYQQRAVVSALSGGKITYPPEPVDLHPNEENLRKTEAQFFEAYAISFNHDFKKHHSSVIEDTSLVSFD